MNNLGTIVNVDAWMIYHFGKTLKGDWSDIEAKAKNHIECYRDSGISDLVFNIFAQTSVTDSKVFNKLADKYNKKTENGQSVDYTGVEYVEFNHRIAEMGLDIIDLFINHTREMGIRPWISFRMNDVHGSKEPIYFLRSDFIYEAKAKGWIVGEKYGEYSSKALDYAVPEVREKMLAYIKEQLFQYDVYGFELDFMRNPACFDFLNNPDCYKIMNGFMEEVKKIAREAEEHWGHSLKIMVRLCRDIEFNKKYGFDIKYWAENSLVDIAVPTAFWASSDTDMPIREWVKELSPYNVSVSAGFEGFIVRPFINQSIETMKAQTVQYYYQGASQMYLFNFFGYDEVYAKEYTPLLWKVCSSPELAKEGVRRYVMTYQDDIFGFYDNIWKPLPAEIDGEKTYEIHTGFVADDEELLLYLDVDDEEAIDVFFNNSPAALTEKEAPSFIEEADSELGDCNIVAYKVKKAIDREASQILTIKAKNKTTVRYIELKTKRC